MAAEGVRSEWRTFFTACFRKRLPSQKTSSLLQAFEAKHPSLPSTALAKVLLDAGCRDGGVDPRLSSYQEALLDSKKIDFLSLLSSIEPFRPEGDVALDQNILDPQEAAKPSVQAITLPLLTRKISNGIITEDIELLVLLKTLVPWVNHFPSSITLGFLISAILGCPVAQEILPGAKAKKIKTAFGRVLTLLVGNLSQTNMQLAGALDYWQKHYQLYDAIPAQMNLLNGVDLGTVSFQESVLDNEPINTRAGLYVYLNAALCERPLFDDLAVMNYLNMRFKSNVPALVADLILASFDILANAMYRAETTQSINILRSFLVNKLPAFLSNYAAIIFAPLSIETCINQALLRVDPAAFPSFSQMFDLLGKNSILSEARQEFLFACALQQLIPESSIEGLLGDVPMQSLPASGKYVKNELVAQCTANPARFEELVGELENMEGNAEEIAGALIEIITTLCSNNDTMTLKCICNCIVRKPATLDTITLFCSPQTILQPMCQLLDQWQEHEDQVENQPVYDEFGSVLLLVSTIRHRFDLDLTDLGALASGSFVSRYFRSACDSRGVDVLTAHENELLGGWIRGLFETEGINDELMSTCKPAEFHLLVATLFDQSVKACQARVLALDTLTGGFEYLLEPFLLPSLTAGLTWFAHKLWETKDPSPSIDTLIPALSTLIRHPSMSSDSAAIHSAVLAIVAGPLEEALTHAQRVYKLRVDISPLLETLNSHMQQNNRDTKAYSELETWAAAPRMGLQTALSNSINGLLLWCLTESSGATGSPPNYTHRLMRACVQLLGAQATLKVLVDELLSQISAGQEQSVDYLFDIIVSLVVAPQPNATSPRLTLKDVLRTQSQEANELSKTDADRARVIVRLDRRVENFSAASAHDVGGGMAMEVGDGGGLVLNNAEGITTTDLDDVLKHTNERFGRGDFLGGAGGDGFMAMG